MIDELIEKYKLALADAIYTPMGIKPKSAYGLITKIELDVALERRQERLKAESNLTRKQLYKQKKDSGICVFSGCAEATDAKRFGVKYKYCSFHRKYFKEYQANR